MNVFDYAMRMERDGKHYYDKLAASSNVAGLRTIFSGLAADEQKHYEIFLGLKNETPPGDMADSIVLESARNVFEQLRAGGADAGSCQGDLEGYLHAMKVEVESVRLYEEAARQEPRENVRDLLLRIAGEERKHYEIVHNIYDFVNAPNQYLAWGEFSNIDEFRQFGRDVD